MAKEITIFGKQSWPFTLRAREAKSKEGFTVIYRDVIANPQDMEEMQRLTPGNRRVPVLLEDGQVSIGFGGAWKAWTTRGRGIFCTNLSNRLDQGPGGGAAAPGPFFTGFSGEILSRFSPAAVSGYRELEEAVAPGRDRNFGQEVREKGHNG